LRWERGLSEEALEIVDDFDRGGVDRSQESQIEADIIAEEEQADCLSERFVSTSFDSPVRDSRIAKKLRRDLVAELGAGVQ
jgi:predicted methyltransferase MtxX (methanogen marker protein 4)